MSNLTFVKSLDSTFTVKSQIEIEIINKLAVTKVLIGDQRVYPSYDSLLELRSCEAEWRECLRGRVSNSIQ